MGFAQLCCPQQTKLESLSLSLTAVCSSHFLNRRTVVSAPETGAPTPDRGAWAMAVCGVTWPGVRVPVRRAGCRTWSLGTGLGERGRRSWRSRIGGARGMFRV